MKRVGWVTEQEKCWKVFFSKAKFELKHNVWNVDIGYDNWAVIVEKLPEKLETKMKKKEERRINQKEKQKHSKIY